jgi:hypothetical protein
MLLPTVIETNQSKLAGVIDTGEAHLASSNDACESHTNYQTENEL